MIHVDTDLLPVSHRNKKKLTTEAIIKKKSRKQAEEGKAHSSPGHPFTKQWLAELQRTQQPQMPWVWYSPRVLPISYRMSLQIFFAPHPWYFLTSHAIYLSDLPH